MDLTQVSAELYELDPADFTAERDRRAAEARGQGDRDTARSIKALRRPSAAAWAVNLLARHQPDQLARLIDLGAQLRDAQAQLDGDELRGLIRQRQQVVAAVGAETRRLAAERGRPISDVAERQVDETLDAALADADAAAAVTTSRLVRALQHHGMDRVDLAGAVAGSVTGLVTGPVIGPAAGASPAGPDPTREKTGEPAGRETTRRDDIAEAAGRLGEAEAELQQAQNSLDATERELRRAHQHLDAANDEIRSLEIRLADSRRDADTARAAVEQAIEAANRAQAVTDAAHQRSDEAAEALARLAGARSILGRVPRCPTPTPSSRRWPDPPSKRS